MSSPTPAGRYLPLSGVVYAALLVAGAAAFPAPPGGDVSAASDPTWLGAHYNAVIAQGYVRALAAMAFLGLTVAVANASRRAVADESRLPTLALVGGTLTAGSMLLAQAAVLAAALFAHAGGGADATRALGALQNGMLDLSAVPATLLFAATGVVGLRTGFVPRWLAVLSLAGVPFALVDAASYDGGPLASVGMLGLVYFLAWSLVVAVHLHLSAARVDPTRALEPSLVR